MRGYIIKTSRWEEVVNESQLITFANDCNGKRHNLTSALETLKKEGVEIETVTLYGSRL